MEIKAIQTRYNGRLFRSRLEARWAVFFDCLDINYEYEPEGYVLQNGDWYLPDFLISSSFYLEIKGQAPTHSELEKLHLLAVGTKKGAILVSGSPGYKIVGITQDEYLRDYQLMYHTCYPDEEGLMAMDNRKPRITEYFAPDLQFSDCRRGNGLCLDMIYPYEGESGFIWAHPMDCGCDGQRGGWISPRLLAACIEARSARF